MERMVTASRTSRMSSVEPEVAPPIDRRIEGLWESNVIGLLNLMADAGVKRFDTAPGYRGLTPREREVLAYLALGQTNCEVAKVLDISIKTVDTHRGKLLKKLNLRGNSDLTWYALRYGIVPLMRDAEERRLTSLHTNDG